MDWTFGIITAGNEWKRISIICDTIRNNAEDNYYDNDQIVVVGGENIPVDMIERHGIVHIPFREDVKAGWITRKKNLIAQVAYHENICMLHDYVGLEKDWQKGFEEFGDDWLTCITPIKNQDGERFRDWCVIYNDSWMNPPIDDQSPPGSIPGRLLEYGTRGHERWQYYSGAYYCVKKEVALALPLDENRGWGQGEDVQWSRLLYQKYGREVFNLNEHSPVRFLKQKENAPWEKFVPLGDTNG
jgi:hypothetical protein